ncbi:MAG: ATP phosphoribosyltransferase [Vampirovibrio sp.]|nr:ATP phosphoribosyltransferase [Vampirovibrio sp.]
MSSPQSNTPSPLIKMVIPKGRLQEKVIALLKQIGVKLTFNDRSYRPMVSDPVLTVKLLKAQNIPALISLGRHDCGFTGHDWVLESKEDQPEPLESLLDLGFNKVRIVAAVPEDILENGQLPDRKMVVATEYPNLAKSYLEKKGVQSVIIKTYGATEALPPEDADMIVDNTSTGNTLRMNRLAIIDTLLNSTTHFICSKQALSNPAKKEKLTQMTMLMQSTLNAQEKVLLEMNVPSDRIDALVTGLPAMKSPTIAQLHGGDGFAVKTAVAAKDVPNLIPQLLEIGARDILEYRLEKLVP